MELYSEIRPVNDQIVFEFLEDTSGRKFNEKSAGGILVVEDSKEQIDYSRWARVLDKGSDVSDIVNIGDIVLVKALCWTTKFKITDKSYWATTEESILAVWDDSDNLPSEVA